MNQSKPDFHLRRVESVDAVSPRLYPLESLPSADAQPSALSRRTFLGKGLLLGSVLAMIDGSTNTLAAADPPAPGQDAPQANPNDKGQPIVVLAHEEAIRAIAISPDGQYVATGSDDEMVKIWSMRDGNLFYAFEGFDKIKAIAFNRKGSHLAIGDDSGNVRVHAMADGNVLDGFANLKRGILATRTMWFTDDGQQLSALNREGQLQTYTVPEGETVEGWKGPQGSISGGVFSQDGKTLLTLAKDRVAVWNVAKGERSVEIHLVGEEKEFITASSVVIPPGSRNACVGLSNGCLEFYDVVKGERLRKLPVCDREISAVASDGKILASGAADGSIFVWLDSVTVRPAFLLKAHVNSVTVLALSPDGKTLVSGDENGVLCYWDLTKGILVFMLRDAKIEGGQVNVMVVNNVAKNDDVKNGNEPKNEGDQKSPARPAGISGTRVLTFTQPCGSPIPPGAVCVCNCVPGVALAPRVPQFARSDEPKRAVIPKVPVRPQPREERPTPIQPYIPTQPRSTRTYRAPRTNTRTTTRCTCNLVCTCVPVFR